MTGSPGLRPDASTGQRPDASTRQRPDASTRQRPDAPRLQEYSTALTIGIGVFAVYHLTLALFMAVAPRTFYTQIGPFGALNDHYIRDVATYNAAIGIALVVALRRPSWRVPVLALAAIQFGLHSVNHLLDINQAHPTWTGYFDFFSLLVTTVVLVWLCRVAMAERTVPQVPANTAETALEPKGVSR